MEENGFYENDIHFVAIVNFPTHYAEFNENGGGGS